MTSYHTKSVRQLEINVAAADDDITHVTDERFNLIFEVLDHDNNGTLDKKEAYALVRQVCTHILFLTTLPYY